MTNKDPELLPCQVSDAMIEAGINAALADPWIKLDIDAAGLRQSGFVTRIYTAMNTVSTIPTNDED